VAETHALTLDDVFALERVSDAQISPDGARVAFVVARDYTEGEHKIPASAIWLAPSDGSGHARRFTQGPHADTQPRWSPDGQTLAFLSDREKADVLQVYRMPADGGEARRLTDAKGGVTELKWSPNGARIAFTAPDAPSEEEEQRARDRDDAIHVDHDYKFARLWVVDAEGGEARAITPPEYQVRGFAWYRDGWAVLTSPTPNEDDFSVAWQLLHVADGQPAQAIWRARHGTYPTLAGSRDGRALAWIHSGADAEESVNELWALTADEAPRRVAADYAGGMVWTDWIPAGDALLVTAIDSTRTALGRVAIGGGEAETLLAGRTLAEGFETQPQASVSRDGRRFACVLEDGAQPSNVWVGEVEGPGAPGNHLESTLRRVSTLNMHLRDVALGAVKTMRWQAPDGQEIHGVLVYPSGYEEGERYPLIVHAHGGPNWQWLQRLLMSWHDWAQWLAAHGYAVLLPNPRGSFGRGREFTWSNRRAWGIGDLVDVLSGVDALVERGLADRGRLGIGGWSYGGFMTAWAIGHTDRFKAAVVGAGITDLLSFQASDIPSWLPRRQMLASPQSDLEIYLRCSPITYAEQITTPTLILHGASDERVRLGQGRELYNALRARQVPTEMVVYPRETHFITERHHQQDLLTRVLEWLDRWLKPTG
jgi:dipeptidyl aminopeptidase/acylaminoacyl peptidase